LYVLAGFGMENFGRAYGHLPSLWTFHMFYICKDIWCILWSFGTLYQEKSGNPVGIFCGHLVHCTNKNLAILEEAMRFM
jgi:hypothetical protein